MNLFVYGSLKPQGPAFEVIRPYITGIIGAHTVGFLFQPYGVSWPVIQLHDPLSEDGMLVKGHLYYIKEDKATEALAVLDRFEGYPTLFNRIEHPVVNTFGKTQMAWVYYGKDKRLFENATLIRSGEWVCVE